MYSLNETLIRISSKHNNKKYPTIKKIFEAADFYAILSDIVERISNYANVIISKFTFIVHFPMRAADIPPAAIMTDMGYVARSRAQSLAALVTKPFSRVSCAEIADQPYGAPKQTCVQNAGTNILHL